MVLNKSFCSLYNLQYVLHANLTYDFSELSFCDLCKATNGAIVAYCKHIDIGVSWWTT